MNELIVTYTLTNEESAVRTLILEPWAEEFDLLTGSVIRLDVSAPRAGFLETKVREGYIVVWAWQGCLVTVTLDGLDVTGASGRFPVPL